MPSFRDMPPGQRSRTIRRILREYALASLASVLAVALAAVADRYLSVANLAFIFLTAVLAVAVRTRMSVAVYAAVLCSLAYNFFFTPPRHTLMIADADDVLAVGLFLVVALVCSRLATRLASQVESLRGAQASSRALLRLGQRLAACEGAAQVLQAGAARLSQALEAPVAILVREPPDGPLRLAAVAPATPGLTAQELADLEAGVRSEPAADGPPTRAAGYRIVPLGGAEQPAGLAAWRPARWAREPDPERHRLARAMARDIGLALERARLAEALEQARVQGETERLRNALLSSVSHDLRSPLAAMIGAAGTLASYEDQLPREERRELMQAILEEGQRLDRYIQNLLDMTRLGHGTLHLHRDWIDAGEIVVAAVERLRRLQPAQAVEMALPAGTVLLYVHPALIEQALFNVLENAAHVSPPGAPVRVAVRVAGAELEIQVIDRGPGIPEEERKRIFDMFYSVARGDRAARGTGLGLSICRGMIGAHGGSVAALPAEGGGTVLRLTLPLPSAPEAPA
ncbi:sensor histidine kinase [Fulvimonas yonginensis]|uniref:histidine kinase n=1 Tax=Fulvimonas yonginensis TaxID=1495200 RepID=A0ABU8JEU2_9GAMM